MTDRELLELAAKAAGVVLGKSESGELFYDELLGCVDVEADEYWHPLENDGQALRLVVKLKMLDLWTPAVTKGKSIEGWNEDPYAATRSAIVRAAAEIGKASAGGTGGEVGRGSAIGQQEGE